jgi:hypothetical protein
LGEKLYMLAYAKNAMVTAILRRMFINDVQLTVHDARCASPAY